MAQLKRTGQDREEELRYSSLAVLDDRPHNVVWTRRDLHQNSQLRKANDRERHEMNAKRPELVRNTPEEEAKIARQLTEEPDTYEWTDEDWANATTTEQLFPEAAVNDPRVRLSRGNVITLVNRARTATEEYLAIDQEERRVTGALVMI